MRLLLSGGGFRATLFHLGVIRYLKGSGQLGKIKQIFSVSGGSILAAHLVLHWNKYTSSDEKIFREAADEIIALTRSDLRGGLVRKWGSAWLFMLTLLVVPPSLLLVLQGHSLTAFGASIAWVLLNAFCIWRWRAYWSRIQLLERAYHRFFKSAALGKLRGGDKPDLKILTTNLTTGGLGYFDPHGLCVDASAGLPFIATERLSVAFAVASSSAFPPLFSPTRLDAEVLGINKSVLPTVHYLSDGGVFDNLGIQASQLPAVRGSSNSEPLFVSNAERRFDWATGEAFGLLLSRATRASDIMMDRITTLEMQGLELGHSKVADLRKDFDAATSFLSPDLQRASRNIRTDLDSFHPVEIQLLVYRGYAAARQASEGRHDAIENVAFTGTDIPYATDDRQWLPFPPNEKGFVKAPENVLKNGTTNPWRLAAADRWTAINIILFAILFFGNWPFFYSAHAYYSSRPRLLDLSGKKAVLVRASSVRGEEVLNAHNWLAGQVASLVAPSESEAVGALVRTEPIGTYTWGHPARACTIRFEPKLGVRVTQPTAFVESADNSVVPLVSQEDAEGNVDVFLPTADAGSRLLMVVMISDQPGSQTLRKADKLQDLIEIKVTPK